MYKLVFASLLTVAAAGCGHPTASSGTGGNNGSGSGGATSGTGGNNTSGSGGNNASGSGGNNTSGSGGNNASGSGGNNASGSGGNNASGSGGNNTSGSGGNNTSGSGGSGKMSCDDATLPKDPKLPGYPAADHATYNNMAKTTLANLSSAEKADQMRGTPQPATTSTTYYDDIFRQPDNTAKMIKGFKFRDGPRGVNLDAPINGGGRGGRSTVFPVPAARGATFDVDLEYRIGQAMGDEMVASGQTLLLAPTTNILRHPLWGRAQETYGEDVFLLGRLGTASTAGIQEYVPACAKHYAANNIENQRATKTATMDERTLREIYSRHFEMMIKDGGIACVMAAYNPVSVAGTSAPSPQNKHLLTDIIKGDFGLQGFIMTDWWALSGNNATATGNATTATAGLNAGLDMELPMSIHYKLLEGMIGSGVMQSQLDDAATRILEQKYRFKVASTSGMSGLKAATTSYSGGSIGNNQAHVDLATEAALKSMVLLKNDANALPLKKTGKILVVGTKETYGATSSMNKDGITNVGDDINGGTIDFATGVRVGDVGSSRVDFDAAKAISPFQGIKDAAGSSAAVSSGNAATSGNDAVVVVVGLTPYDEGEEYNGSGDRMTLSLNGKKNNGMQNTLVMQAVSMNPGKPVIVVVEAGGIIDMPWKDMVSAIVMAWYPGMAGGKALGQLLFGDANFSGKMPVTWPASVNDFPTFNGGASTQMDYLLGYRYLEDKGTKPLYQFGYGLSYSGKFKYENLKVPCSDAKAPTGSTTGSVVNVTVDVTNMGTVKGDEVVLLFVSFPMVSKQLKGFTRVSVDAGKTVTATIPIRIADLKYWDGSWKYPSGSVKIMVGSSSADGDLVSDTLMVK